MIIKNSTRLNYLDTLRGIAIILIVLGHMERGMVSLGINASYTNILDQIVYSIHLPLMFILSGMVENIFGKLKSNKVSYIKYLKKNIIALYIPYLIFIYTYWFIKMYIFSGNNEASFSDIFHLFYNGKWIFWFLLSLLSIKSVHGLFEKYITNKYISTLFFGIVYISSLFTNTKLIDWLSYGLFYNMGYLINENNILKKMKKKTLIINLLLLITGLITLNLFSYKIQMLLIGVPVSIILLNVFYKKVVFNFMTEIYKNVI